MKEIKKMNNTLRTLIAIIAASVVAALPLTAGDAGCGYSSSYTHGKHNLTNDLVDTAVGSGSFNTLVAAVKAAGLVDTLKGEGPFTLFAPSDEAFAKLPAGTLEFLLQPENKDELISILTYHVVPGKILAADVKPGSAPTVNGENLVVGIENDAVKINKATVVKTDIKCTNGVIHVVDTVILPPTKSNS